MKGYEQLMDAKQNEKYVLELKNIVKRFPGVLALDNVNLQLKAGEVHVLLGENGAGKSTLIKVMTGAYIPEEGEVLVDGVKVNIKGPIEAQKLGIGAVYQEFNLMPNLTIAENIFMGKEKCSSGILNKKKMVEESARYLEMVGAKLDPESKVSTCGVAQQQMIEIAKALSADARVLILDEPSAVLTNKEIDKLFEIIEGLKTRGVAVVYISHRLEEIRKIGDRITVLRDGTYVDTVEVDKRVFDKDHLIKLMVGREIKDQFPKKQVELGKELLRVENLSSPGKVSNVSFSVKAGEILGIAGLVGAGRTETAKIIFGADSDATGKIFIDGKEVKHKSPMDAIKNGVALAPEDRKVEGLVQGLSIEDNVTMTCFEKISTMKIRNEKKSKKLVSDICTSLKVRTPSIEQKVTYLSGGNQQKVVLAKWMASDSKVMILDEPTRGIDVGAKVEVYQLMTEMVSQGMGIIMISSELPELLAMSDRIIVMSESKIKGELTREEATQERILVLASGGTV